MEQGATEQKIIQDSVKYRMPLPDSIKNAPTLFYGSNLYYTAFFLLSKSRQMGLGTIGYLTYSILVDFCEKNDIIGEQRDDFIYILSRMDEAYIEHGNKKKET